MITAGIIKGFGNIPGTYLRKENQPGVVIDNIIFHLVERGEYVKQKSITATYEAS